MLSGIPSLFWIWSLLKLNKELREENLSQRNLLLSKDFTQYSLLQQDSAQTNIFPDYLAMDDETEADRWEKLTATDISRILEEDGIL
jgi:hypothetical protein